MLRLIGWLAALAGVLAAWTLLLWFVILPDASAMTPLEMVAGHLLPPLAAWSAAFWAVRRRREQRRRGAEADQAARAQAAAESARDQQRAHAAALAKRRYRIPVLAVAFGSWPAADERAGLISAAETVSILAADDLAMADDPMGASRAADGPWPQIVCALDELYARCPGAQAFPVRVQVPVAWRSKPRIDELAAHVGDARRWAMSGAPLPAVDVSSLSDAAPTADGLFALFDGAPRLPGVVVVAADSQLGSAGAAGVRDDADDAGLREHRRWHGPPVHGVAALALANPHLGVLIDDIESCGAEAGVGDMTTERAALPAPFWEATRELPAELQPVAALSEEVRAMLRLSRPLGFVHRPTTTECAPRAGRVGELAQAARRALEQSLVNAGLLPAIGEGPAGAEPAPDAAGSSPQAPDPSARSASVPDCEWLVHNAGGIDCAGQRLAALSLAMHTLGIDLNPIDEATNIATAIGDLGIARPLSMLAQAANQCAALNGPVCWVEFGPAPHFHVGIVTPGDSPDPAALGAA